MRGDARALMQHVEHRRRESHGDLCADEPIRHAVEVALDRDVRVKIDLRRFPFGEFVARRRERLQSRALGRLKDTAPTAGERLKRPRVEAVDGIADRMLEFGE